MEYTEYKINDKLKITVYPDDTISLSLPEDTVDLNHEELDNLIHYLVLNRSIVELKDDGLI